MLYHTNACEENLGIGRLGEGASMEGQLTTTRSPYTYPSNGAVQSRKSFFFFSLFFFIKNKNLQKTLALEHGISRGPDDLGRARRAMALGRPSYSSICMCIHLCLEVNSSWRVVCGLSASLPSPLPHTRSIQRTLQAAHHLSMHAVVISRSMASQAAYKYLYANRILRGLMCGGGGAG